MPSNLISITAENLIIEQEVSSAAVYKKKYMTATWPGGESGPTFGIGVDIGYCDADDLRADWGPYLPPQMVETMARGAGLKREAAHQAVRTGKFSGVVVPWEAALAEFEQVELPRWVTKMRKTFPNTQNLGPDCEGALVSLVFNRGTALDGERRREMLAIRNHLRDGHPERVPAEFRSMKRLWDNGLVARREAEAQLFEKGLRAGS